MTTSVLVANRGPGWVAVTVKDGSEHPTVHAVGPNCNIEAYVHPNQELHIEEAPSPGVLETR